MEENAITSAEFGTAEERMMGLVKQARETALKEAMDEVMKVYPPNTRPLDVVEKRAKQILVGLVVESWQDPVMKNYAVELAWRSERQTIRERRRLWCVQESDESEEEKETAEKSN